MPIYDYLCEDCGTRFEKLVRHPETDVVECPSCGKNRVTQQISSFLSPTPGKLKPPPREHSEYPYGRLGHEHD